MERIFVVDDDPVSLRILQGAFQKTSWKVEFFSSGADLLGAFKPGAVDLIISDFFMPGVDGSDLLRKVRLVDVDVGFIYLTSNQDLEMVVEMVKAGADDHIVKPVMPGELMARVRRNLEDVRQRQLLRHYQEEVRDEKQEAQGLVNWRLMYATKETRQIEQAIALMNRTMNQAGGFMWADIMRSLVPAEPSETVSLPRDLVDITLEAAGRYKELFDMLALIGELDTMPLQMEVLQTADVLDRTRAWMDAHMLPLFAKYARTVIFSAQAEMEDLPYRMDMGSLCRILKELAVNAIKFSPPGSEVVLGWQQCSIQGDTPLIFSLANRPAETQALHEGTWRICGIPREYSEQVFELFYTIDAFPVHLEEEEWRNGTGLHIARRLMRRMGGWIQNHNIMDYRQGKPVPFVEFNLRFPVHKPDPHRIAGA